MISDVPDGELWPDPPELPKLTPGERAEILETFPDATRDPIWAELFSVRPEIVNSQMELLDRPGWGLELNEDTLEKRGVRK